ncbi:hypothetical protein [Pelagicoccus sp. SDUM812002]|uniref:hypothetical protein n=1 Tax=Pelagicoccus sp. SDUM812002 TaxID=3041266 RepID=UPI00280D6A78|nr:hypothetical protein [Pelagicoccus sp. SDUM812002]MDQ8185927.1 hypothetical protein [Pelagicoccus sp. SDUM812002]
MSQSALPKTLLDAVTAKCGTIRSQSMAWERSLVKALASGASERSLLLLAEGFKSSRTLDTLAEGLVREPDGVDGFMRQLRTLVDESDFDLAAWLGAYECVQTHLSAAGRSASPSSIVGYVQCSAEFGGSAENRDSLPGIIGDMLEKYGFEGQEGCGTGPVA